MGFLDTILNIFSRSGKSKPKGKKPSDAQSATGAPRKGSSTEAPKRAQAAGTAKPARKPAPQTGDSLSLSVPKKDPKRKKARQVKAAPIDESALGFSISLKGEDERAKKRNALRIKVKGLTVFIHRLKKQFPVTDISATGLGFAFEKPHVKGGVKLVMDIYLEGVKKAGDIECKVMRHERGSVGCIFIDLDRHQDDAVHEIVLLGQKQQTERKNAMKDLEFKLPS